MPLLPDSIIDGTTSNTSSQNHSLSGLPVNYNIVSLIFISVLVIIIIILIVFGNLLVVIAIATDRNLKLIQNWFIASLAVADFLLGLVIMPFSLANELMGYWYFGPIWCDLWKSIDVFLCTASILSICLISLDRYWSVTRALEYARQRTSKRAAFMITSVWFLSAVICIPPLIGWKNPLPVSDYPLCLLSGEVGYVIYSSMGSFYIPAVIMVFVYLKIYVAAKARARRHGKGKPKPTAKTSKDTKCSKNENIVIVPPKVFITKEKIIKENDNESPAVSDDESTWPMYEKQTSLRLNMTECRQLDEKTKLLLPEEEIMNTESKTELKINELCENKVLNMPTDDIGGSYSRAQYTQSNIETGIIRQTSQSEPKLLSTETWNKLAERDDGNHISPENNEVGSCDSEEDSGIQLTTITTAVENRNDQQKTNGEAKKFSLGEMERQKKKIAKARERRATLILGLVMAAFILCWCPFFTLYIASSLCNFCVPNTIFAVFFWAGYCNSALNPIIYTIFNRDFRQAFHKIITGQALCFR